MILFYSCKNTICSPHSFPLSSLSPHPLPPFSLSSLIVVVIHCMGCRKLTSSPIIDDTYDSDYDSDLPPHNHLLTTTTTSTSDSNSDSDSDIPPSPPVQLQQSQPPPSPPPQPPTPIPIYSPTPSTNRGRRPDSSDLIISSDLIHRRWKVG